MKSCLRKEFSLRSTGRSNAGFTLSELMVAAAILTIAITGTLATFINASFLSQANRNKSIAASDASYVLEKLKSTSFADLASYTDTSYANLPSESISVTVTSLTNAKDVVANVTWVENKRQRSYQLYTQVSW